MVDKIQERVIPQEEAVFWLDKDGCWNNQNGKFQHQKIIRYFHTCIRRDRRGYYLYQTYENFAEKVYFPYEDQALFVFDVIGQDAVTLVLNTGRQIQLKPRKLFIKDDCLYMQAGQEIIKFAERGLLKIAPLLEQENDRLFIRVNSRRYRVPSRREVSASS